VIDVNGNVGMGTLTPQTVLHVKSNPSSTQTAIIRLESEAANANSSISYYSANVNRWEVGTGISLGLLYEIYDRVAGQTRFSITTSGAAVFSNGNVGIGMTSPTNKLDVSGDTRISGGLTATTISATTYYNLPTDIFVTGGTYSNNTFTYRNNTGGTFNVLFNTVTGLTVNGNLTVTGGTQSLFSGNTSSDLVRITQTGSGNAFVVEDSPTNDGSKFIIDNIGNVGIGITPSDAKLYAFNSTGGTAIYGISSNIGVIGNGGNYGVQGLGTFYGVYGSATNDSGSVVGVWGAAGQNEFGLGEYIGGKFTASSSGGVNYSLQLTDTTEGLNKVLVSKTLDGKANWSSILSGLTGVYTSILSATTYNNLPKVAFSPMNIAVCDTAPTAASTQYYYQTIAEVTTTLSKVKLWGFSGSDLVLFGLYRGTLQSGMTLIGQARKTCGIGPNELTLTAETGQTLAIVAGEDLVIGYYPDGASWRTIYDVGISDIFYGLINTGNITTMPATPTGTATGIRFACTLY
jgi:hypothetical protein